MLDGLHEELNASGITLAFAELKDPVRAKLRRYGALEAVPDELFFPTVGTAVSGYLASTGEPWTDWEEGSEGESGHGPVDDEARAAGSDPEAHPDTPPSGPP
jgi:hypothetical protein